MPTASGVDIRRLGVADLPAYKRLRDAMLQAHPEAFSSDASEAAVLAPDDYRSRLGLDRPEGGVFALGAWLGDVLAGAVNVERDRRLKVRHTAHLTGMMVRAEFSGRGIGQALLATALDSCREGQGLAQITLSVTATNLGAIRLYERAGFVRYGSLAQAMRVEGRDHTKDLMVRSL